MILVILSLPFLLSTLCYSAKCFFFLLTTVVPITAPPLMNSNAIHSILRKRKVYYRNLTHGFE